MMGRPLRSLPISSDSDSDDQSKPVELSIAVKSEHDSLSPNGTGSGIAETLASSIHGDSQLVSLKYMGHPTRDKGQRVCHG